jgi:hypothetical protein
MPEPLLVALAGGQSHKASVKASRLPGIHSQV